MKLSYLYATALLLSFNLFVNTAENEKEEFNFPGFTLSKCLKITTYKKNQEEG